MTTHVVTDEQLGIYARREHDLFRRIREGTLPVERVLDGLQSMIEGKFDAAPESSSRLIDCDARPFVPDGWSSKKEDQLRGAVGGKLVWGKTKTKLFLAEKQKKGVVSGNDLRKELEGKPVLKANVLDYLLAHPELIPEEWKGKMVFFWGTIYRVSDGCLCVRYLFCVGDRWDWDCRWLDDDWDSSDPAAVQAR